MGGEEERTKSGSLWVGRGYLHVNRAFGSFLISPGSVAYSLVYSGAIVIYRGATPVMLFLGRAEVSGGRGVICVAISESGKALFIILFSTCTYLYLLLAIWYQIG